MLLGSIYFLRLTDRAQSVEAVFKIIKEIEDELNERLKGAIVETLFRSDSTLKNTQEILINENIDELLKHADPGISKRAKELSKRAVY